MASVISSLIVAGAFAVLAFVANLVQSHVPLALLIGIGTVAGIVHLLITDRPQLSARRRRVAYGLYVFLIIAGTIPVAILREMQGESVSTADVIILALSAVLGPLVFDTVRKVWRPEWRERIWRL
jgi:hypothetical protein